MEMTWMETFRLLGLDLLAFVLIALVGLDVVEHAVHSAWETAHARKLRSPKAVAAPRVSIGGIKRI
jgi:hypothetical protein